MEVLGLVASGKTNKEIAEELVLSIATVKKHLEHIRTKTAAGARRELSSLFERLQGG
jgi:DNA-binding CsgD family transcriptional regulator